MTFVAGCAGEVTKTSDNVPIAKKAAVAYPDWPLHMIVADKYGKVESKSFPENYECMRVDPSDGPQPDRNFYDCHIENVLSHLAAAARLKLQEKKKLKLLIFIHGGLNGLKSSAERVRLHTGQILRDGYYPIYLNWNTSGFSSYGDQVLNVRQGERIDSYPNDEHRHKRRAIRALETAIGTPLYFIGDVLEGFVRAPASWLNQGTQLLETGFLALRSPDQTYGGSRWPDVRDSNNVISLYEDKKPPLNVTSRALFTATAPVKLLTVPFVDSLGKTAWDNMLRRSRAVIRTHSDLAQDCFDRSLPNGPGHACSPKGSGAFALFMSDLDSFLDKRPLARSGKTLRESVEKSLIGHSMGAIVANDLLREFDIHFDNIVYMAGAATIRHSYNTLISYLCMTRHSRSRFYNLSLHPAADAREITFGGVAPSGSLLEWIDGMYEETDSPLDRTIGKWLNVSRSKHIFSPSLQSRMIFKVFGTPDQGPWKHGDFNDEIKIASPANPSESETIYNYWMPRYWGDRALFAKPESADRAAAFDTASCLGYGTDRE